MNVCGLPAWQALRALSGSDHARLRGRSLGEHSPGGAKEQGWRIRDPMSCGAVAPRGPMEWGLVCSAGYSFRVLWHGEDFH
jgi:hypothetical protein